MSDDDIHDMMDRAHWAEIREHRLRIEVDRLKADNERLTRERDEVFRMNRCESGPDECYDNLVKLHEEIACADLEAAQRDLRLCRGEDTAEKYRAAMAEIETLRADAFRYRWICRFPEDADYSLTHALNRCDGTGDGPSFRDLLSTAIDAALSPQEQVK
jgi:hypothetical protein